MNSCMKVKFEFHKVGQGLFYTGKIGEFNFVYDCGSERKNPLLDAIRSYEGNFHKEGMDMLIISHFHRDHVSGLDYLLQNIGVADVIIPYFTPLERLIVALRWSNLPKWYSKWYYDFLRDPVSYFLERGARRVIIVGGPKKYRPPLSEDDLEEEKILPPEEKKPKIPAPERETDIHEMSDDEDLKEVIIVNDSNWGDFMRNNKLFVKKHDNPLTILKWIFRFFNFRLEENKLNDFEKCLEGKGFSISPASLKNAITTAKTREILKDCYNPLQKDPNNTSLVAYHGPVDEYRSDFTATGNYGLFFNGSRQFSPSMESEPQNYVHENRMGQFLTGDIDLNYELGQLVEHYKDYLDKILISQIPHHGSRKSWNKEILDVIQNCSHWVASSGISNQYGHPHINVAHDISKRKCCFCWCNQRKEFIIDGEVEWY